MDYYIETIHRVLDLSFVTESHIKVDVTSVMSGMRIREVKIVSLAEWNNIKANGYYTKELSDKMQARMVAARKSERLDQIANDREIW